MFVLSHITAFEYWRQAQAAPKRCRTLPKRFLPNASTKHLIQKGSAPSEALLEAIRQTGADPGCFTQPFHLLDVRGSRSNRHIDIRYHSAVKYLENKEALSQSFLKIGRGLYAPSPELCFLQLAQILDLENLVIAGCELCSTYRYAPDEDSGLSEIKPLSTPATIKSFLAKCPGAYGIKRARTAAERIVPNAASPVEFALALLLCLPRNMGGYGLPKPLLNYEISLGRFAGILTHRGSLRADLYWPDQKIDLEYNSDAHHIGKRERAEDAERANTLSVLGIQSIDVTWEQIVSLERTNRLAASMRTHLKHYSKALTSQQEIRQYYLRTKTLRYLASKTFEQPKISQQRIANANERTG